MAGTTRRRAACSAFVMELFIFRALKQLQMHTQLYATTVSCAGELVGERSDGVCMRG